MTVLKGFWNDPDGLSITDIISLTFITFYFILAIYLFHNGLTEREVDFFNVVTWNTLTILGGYFASGVVRIVKNTNLRGGLNNNGVQAQEPEAMDGNSSSGGGNP